MKTILEIEYNVQPAGKQGTLRLTPRGVRREEESFVVPGKKCISGTKCPTCQGVRSPVECQRVHGLNEAAVPFVPMNHLEVVLFI